MITLWKDAAFRSPFYGALFALGGWLLKETVSKSKGKDDDKAKVAPELREHLDNMISEYIAGGDSGLAAWLLKNADEVKTEADATMLVSKFETNYPLVVERRKWVASLGGSPARAEA